jgi:hypothetical protein
LITSIVTPPSKGERLRGDDLAHAQRNAEVGAKRLTVSAQQRQFLDRSGGEIRLAQGLDVGGTAAFDPAPRQVAEAIDGTRNPCVGQRERAPGHQIDLLAPLLLDEIVQPKAEGRHRQACQHDADYDRDELFTPREDHADLALPRWRSAVKAGLSIKPPPAHSQRRRAAAALTVSKT